MQRIRLAIDNGWKHALTVFNLLDVNHENRLGFGLSPSSLSPLLLLEPVVIGSGKVDSFCFIAKVKKIPLIRNKQSFHSLSARVRN